MGQFAVAERVREIDVDPAGPMLDVVTAHDFTRPYVDRIVGEAAIVAAQLSTPEGNDELARTWPSGRLVSVFYERSTRTRGSTEAAAAALGMKVISFPDAMNEAKNEPLEDAAVMFGAQGNVVVVRHPRSDTAQVMTRALDTHLKGWMRPAFILGGAGEKDHPTQALVDAAAIQRDYGRQDDLHWVLYGGTNNRTARSFVQTRSLYHNNTFTFVTADGQPELDVPQDLRDEMDAAGTDYTITHDFHAALREADGVYACRIKNERRDGAPLPPPHTFGTEEAALLRPGAKLYHALPRDGEISHLVDTSDVAGYMDQAIGAVSVRVVLLRDAREAKLALHEQTQRVEVIA
jgi:aspartate carbamoyltransferase catalytic subunit